MNEENGYWPQGCRLLAARLLWDAVVEYVKYTGVEYEDAASFLHSPGGRLLLESMSIDPDAALDHIQRRRWHFQRLVLMAYLDPMYENAAKEWWKDFYGHGFM